MLNLCVIFAMNTQHYSMLHLRISSTSVPLRHGGSAESMTIAACPLAILRCSQAWQWQWISQHWWPQGVACPLPSPWQLGCHCSSWPVHWVWIKGMRAMTSMSSSSPCSYLFPHTASVWVVQAYSVTPCSHGGSRPCLLQPDWWSTHHLCNL
jgi:hypothetical protein